MLLETTKTQQRTAKKIAKNGWLSGMVLPAAAGLVVLPLGLFSESFRARFDAPLTPGLRAAFLASIIVMVLHKAESYWLGEFDRCPTYLNAGKKRWAQNPREAIFMAFVPTFLGMMFVAYLAFMGPPWHLMLLSVWLAQGLHELHHIAKSAARKRWYPGALTAAFFVGVMNFWVFPQWWDLVLGSRGGLFYAWYALLPIVFAAFYFEDRRWIAGTDESIWNPA